MGEGMDSWLLFWFVLLGISVNEVEGHPQQELAAGQGPHQQGQTWGRRALCPTGLAPNAVHLPTAHIQS